MEELEYDPNQDDNHVGTDPYGEDESVGEDD